MPAPPDPPPLPPLDPSDPAAATPPAAAAADEEEDDRVFLVPLRWWKEAQQGLAINVPGLPYAAAPAGPTSYGMRVLSMFLSDQTYTLRRADELLQQTASFAARSYALLPADLFSKAREWYIVPAKSAVKNVSPAGEGSVNIYPIMLRVSASRDTYTLTVKIGKKDNSTENFKRACKILTADSEPVHIWDFSGRTTYIVMTELNRSPHDSKSADQEMPLQIHIYDLSEPMVNGSDGKRDELALTLGGSSSSNGGSMNMDLDSSSGSSKQVGSGLTGLDNLGNTCFMNSAVQCLAHTSKLVDYFLGDFHKEVNPHNPLGMKGELAYAFGDLLRKLWAIDRTPVAPRQFKARLGRFAPQFSGFNQHDSQELLAFLLDGLHEDLNRVKCKPYSEAKDSDGRPDEEVADEYWGNHLARNDSIIVDICQGQYKSTLVCPICKKVSVTFDPFMYLSLPLPSTTMRTMTITVFSTDGTSGPSPYTISVPKSGDTRTLINALSSACSLRDDERLLVAEVYNNSLIRYLDEPSEVISLIRDGDRLVAYRLPKDNEDAPIVVFRNQRMESSLSSFGRKSWKTFGTPLVSSLPDTVTGSNIYNLFLKVMTPFRVSRGDAAVADQTLGESSLVDETEDINMSSDASEHTSINNNSVEDETGTEDVMQFFLTNERIPDQRMKIEMDLSITVNDPHKRLHVAVCWEDSGLDQYNFSSLNSLPEVYKAVLFSRRPQDTCSLYACLEAFIKEEPLGPEDMWYCPGCKEHRQASKKLDLWRLPEILIIHLKRFSYSRYTKNKLETFVDFPIHDLDLSKYIGHRCQDVPHNYRLYATSNHYGSLGGGHYTAYVYHEGKKGWYDFDDRHVGPITEDSIKTSAAYVLFYRRIQEDSLDTVTDIDSDIPT
ncbi:Ubiquitin carboxyl-terminal hydrolase 8 [Zea mays]|uniref:Ubiquitin carboxyl-terminal hydrolase n=4 Tax=Zea mays TaxID=4577 RepID=A0A1D6MVD8_MAIZE|nr:ubiquitin carboxyl-terminal hydrolase 8 [Zea mays]ONM32780.1 ubiquitin-specific protease 8 [Zea mays]PWZ32034.1 Ubiquitin carboxyl-terminal hydrolase 8 [Zea mays]|eukprot:XP_008674106.1 ubiquitin carboxyl-terminal hydrolase 8 [Zea mays]